MKRIVMLPISFVCLLSLCVSAQDAAGIKEVLRHLEEKMSAIETLRSSFIQEKELAVFEQKIIIKGNLFLKKPSLFAWHIDEPIRYSLVIDSDRVCQWDEETGELKRFSLSKNPLLQTVAEQMQKWFFAAYTTMFDEYEISILTEIPLSLKFVPRGKVNFIEYVTVSFKKNESYIHRIYIKEKGGDATQITFYETQLNIPLAQKVWEAKNYAR